MGQARVTSVSAHELSRRDQSTLDGQGETGENRSALTQLHSDAHSTIVQFKGSIILISGPCGLVHLWKIKESTVLDVATSGTRQPEYWQTYRSSRPNNISPLQDYSSTSLITCLSLDTSTGKTVQDWQKVMVGYDSGHFSIFEYSEGATLPKEGVTSMGESLREIGNTVHLSAWSEVGGIVAASFHYPILTTCSDDGAISIYMIHEEPSRCQPHHWCRLLHRLYGTSTGSPIGVSLDRISPIGNANRWRTLVSFGLELYDGSWTVRLQETEFDERYILRSVEIGTDAHQDGENVDMEERYGSSLPDYFKSSSPDMTSSCVPSAGHVRIGTISAIGISWPFVVTTHSDNTLNVFQMARKSDWESDSGQKHSASQQYAYSSPHKEILRFQHLSTLYGHCGAVSSVSIESQSGRLVSASMDRSIKVWTMTMKNQEGQLEQQRVHRCVVSMSDINKSWTESGQVTKEEGLGLTWVGSDDEKIVSMNCDGTVKVWQFC
ncbi:hypothetical protein BGZ80_011598 [Entomortierella chlamydospora]|uniref:WD40 repeat-like protein n=1 Tax=Entomortierella chlamydospora TaxID=101097 RepID=A0A9P6MTA6_9FUNG|nr:hypothetical protein BGZ79_006874 [Entomortierella chlamydospora]KAG0012663.1 hypothetical protein BGZ80_011598 [Entomortierella chlamydospora]